MTVRYVLAPQAALDLAQIWHYIRKRSSVDIANRAESVIRDRIVFLAQTPWAGHWRRDLTTREVKVFPVYSYLIVYKPETKPLEVVSILHGHQDVERILSDRT
jgi:toxin ParE1/3/4